MMALGDVIPPASEGGYSPQTAVSTLDWASAGIRGSERRVENLLTVVGQELACTVDLEYMERAQDGRTYHRVLRCTQVYPA